MLPKFRSLITFTCASVLLVGTQLTADTSKTYTAPDFSKAKPVELEIVQQSGPIGARLVYPTSEGVEIEMAGGEGRIILKWGYMDQFQINVPMTKSLETALSHPMLEKRAQLLKDEVEPLLPLASITEGNTNIHNMINAYLKAVIKVEDWLAAYDISQKISLDLSPASTVQHFYQIAEHLFVSGEQEKALNLLDQLVAARPASETRDQTLSVAERLLDLRLFEPAYSLFRAIAEDSTGLLAKQVMLRCAYINLELGDQDEAARYISKAKEITEENELTRGALQIVLGVQACQQDDPALALNYLGHGLALVMPDSGLKQIGLYFNYISYEKFKALVELERLEAAEDSENTEIAAPTEDVDAINIPQNILDEMQLLFPDGAYTAVLAAQIEPIESSDETETSDTTETL